MQEDFIMAKQKAYGLPGIFIITYWDKSRIIFDLCKSINS